MQVRWRNNEQKLTLKPPRSLNGEFNTTVSQAQLDKPKLEMGRKHIEDTFKRAGGGGGVPGGGGRETYFERMKQKCWSGSTMTEFKSWMEGFATILDQAEALVIWGRGHLKWPSLKMEIKNEEKAKDATGLTHGPT